MNEKRECRVSVCNNDIVIFYETLQGFFHGHVRTWVQLKTSGKIGFTLIDVLKRGGK